MKSKKATDPITSLSRLQPGKLYELYRVTFNAEPPAGSPECARRKIAWHWQAATEGGGLPDSARDHAIAIAASMPARARIVSNKARRLQGVALPHLTTTQLTSGHDARLPMPGSAITKQYKGRLLVVKVLNDEFEFERKRYASLSAIAREVTGTRWNGFAFFGLAKES